MKKEAHHLLVIEVVRFLAALSVLVWHYQQFTFVSFKPVKLVVADQPLYSVFWPFYERGLLGVQVFWAVSGFIFFWKYKVLLAGRLIGAKKFFILRFSRLYPLHLVTLLLVVGLQLIYFSLNQRHFVYGFYDLKHFILQLFFASNWVLGDLSFNGPIWSVSCEILVYVFFFLYVTRFNPGIRATATIFLACALLSILHIDHNVTNCLKYFMLGGLSFECYQLMLGRGDKKQFDRKLLVGVGVVLLTLFITYQLDILRFKHYTFVLLLLIPLVLYFSPQKLTVSERAKNIINGFGNLTYSSYLTHFPIQLVMVSWYSFKKKAIPFYDVRFFVFYLLVVFVISYLTYCFFERPAQNLIRRRWLH